VLKSVQGKPESFAVNMAILRSMERAEYAPRLDEHFALASEHYVHFTSPIRRYPDLTVHRLLDEYLRGAPSPSSRRGGARAAKGRRRRLAGAPSLEQCEELGTHCSNNERRAEAAERELKLVYILRLLERDLGAEYQGVVTGVANFGLFVQLDGYLIEGLLRFEDLPNDWWEVDAAAGCVVGQRTGKRFKIGDRMRVVSAAIDLAARELDLALADAPAGPTPRSARHPRTGSKRPTRRAKQPASTKRRSRPVKKTATTKPRRKRR
jgi:ribonuclease R